MPHTDAISLAATLGLLLIILKIVSVVSVGVSVEIVGVSVVKEEVSVVISVEIVEVSNATFALFPSLRRKSYCAQGILNASRHCPPSVLIFYMSLSTNSGIFTHDLL